METSVQNVRGLRQLSNWHLVSGLKLNAPMLKMPTGCFGSFSRKMKNLLFGPLAPLLQLLWK